MKATEVNVGDYVAMTSRGSVSYGRVSEIRCGDAIIAFGTGNVRLFFNEDDNTIRKLSNDEVLALFLK